GSAVRVSDARRRTRVNGHGGELALAALSGYGVREMFTLSGGHIFPFYDAVAKGTYDDWRIFDVRHEQTATFAAEATAKLTRRPGRRGGPPRRGHGARGERAARCRS